MMGVPAEKRAQALEILEKLHNKETTPAKIETQESLIQHLKLALAGTDKAEGSEKDTQRELLRAFLTNSNKTEAAGGVTTLKPEILKRITGEPEKFSMVEWLARRNKMECCDKWCERESDLGDEMQCKHKKKSGIHDKSTSNIVTKEIWPQKNLLEDWADEEIDFKNLTFDQFVAGETKTIEDCTEPAQIMGRMYLLRQMAYAKMRGYEWSLIRKMYAAILRGVETKEVRWGDSLERYEKILYRRPPPSKAVSNINHRLEKGDREDKKKWFCRDYNRDGCHKTSPHKAWFGTGTNAVQRQVIHMCAVCYLKDKNVKEHSENSPSVRTKSD